MTSAQKGGGGVKKEIQYRFYGQQVRGEGLKRIPEFCGRYTWKPLNRISSGFQVQPGDRALHCAGVVQHEPRGVRRDRVPRGQVVQQGAIHI